MIRLSFAFVVILAGIVTSAWLIRARKWEVKRIALTAVIVAVVVASYLTISLRNLARFQPEQLKTEAVTALTQAGGVNAIYKEADQIFKHFGVVEQHWFTEADLKPYPAISSLGDVDFISPKDQYGVAYIQVRVHLPTDHFLIFISEDSTNESDLIKNHSVIEVEPRILAGK